MSAQLLAAFLLFAVSISLTPGAGNVALLGISSRYGFLRPCHLYWAMQSG